MENFEKFTTEDVDHINATEYTPAIVLMTLVVIIGLTGNTFAAIFYIWKAQKSVINFFISCLSVNDAITNAVLVQEIVQLFYYLSCDNIIMCKVFVVLKHLVVGNSLLFMVALAVDRYRRVCFPFSKQITYPVARYIMLGLTLFSFLIASRNIATVDIYKFNITADGNSTITGYYCTQSRKKEFAQIKTIFHIVDICIHGIVMISFVTLNILLVRKIVKTKRKLEEHGPLVSFNLGQHNNETSVEASSTDVVHIDFSQKNDADRDTERSSEKKLDGRVKDDTSIKEDKNTKEVHKPDLRNKHKSSTLTSNVGTLRRTLSHVHSSWIEIKITMMVVMITIISALCFVPYYVAILTVKQDFSGSATIMTVGEILSRRSYILNSAVNPYIMLVFNVPFRQFVLDVVCRLCLRYKKVLVKQDTLKFTV